MEEAEALRWSFWPALEPIIETLTSFIPAPRADRAVALSGPWRWVPWLGKKKRTAEKVSASLVQGIDIFRDILDQTPQGERIDASLVKALKDQQHALRVEQEIHKLLQRYATPTKEPSQLEDKA